MGKNFLKKTTSYLIGPMENLDGQAWREQVKKELSICNITFYDPYKKNFLHKISEDAQARSKLIKMRLAGKYRAVSKHMRLVRSLDLSLVDRSDFLICYIHPTVYSLGTCEELVTAVRAKKPIFVFIEGGKKFSPLWLLGMIPHKYIYNNVEEVIKIIKKIDNNTVKLDSRRWKLLEEKYR